MSERIKTVYPVPRLLTAPNLFAGEKSLKALKGLACSRVLLLTGRSVSETLKGEIKKSLSCDTVLEALRPEGGDPSFASAQSIWKQLAGMTPDCIVAVGGGAVLDLAKLILLLLEWPEATHARMSRPFALPPLKKRTRLVAIPTTAGSGSEVSSSALIIDDATRVKTAIVTHDFIADVVLLDPRFLLNIPRRIMVAGMVDAMTHAVEGFLSVVANPLADSLAESAVRLLGRYGPLWLQGGEQDLTIIQQLLIASHQAGMVQNQCGVGICHSLAHQMVFFGIGHGEANGLFLSSVLNYNCQERLVADRFSMLSENSGVAIIEWLQQMQKAAGLVRSLQEITGAASMDRNQISQQALDDICTRFNPRQAALADFADLLDQSLKGKRKEPG